MPKALTFETGLVEYDINGTATVSFNPTDEYFVQKLYETFTTLDKLQDSFAKGTDFSQFVGLDKDMRLSIDKLLGEGVSDALFADMNCYALAGGLPVWTNLILALLDEVSSAYESEFGKTDARMKAHEKKYNAMIAKYKGKK